MVRDGVVVDGFPRTSKQAELLNNFHDEQTAYGSVCTPFCIFCVFTFYLQPPNIMFLMLHVDEAESVSFEMRTC